jgi:hypothetical protein
MASLSVARLRTLSWRSVMVWAAQLPEDAGIEYPERIQRGARPPR